jgi:hypothetical protein
MWDKIKSFFQWVEGILKWWTDRKNRKQKEENIKNRN